MSRRCKHFRDVNISELRSSIIWNWGLKRGIDVDSGSLGYVLWCCGSKYLLQSFHFFFKLALAILCPWSEKHTVFKLGASLRYILFLGGLFLGLLPWQYSRFQKVCCHPHSQWENKCKIHLPWQCSYPRQILGRSCRWTSGHTYGWNKRSSHKTYFANQITRRIPLA